MEHTLPTFFPRRVKRYQSYSMTPLNFRLEQQTNIQNSNFIVATDKNKPTGSSRQTSHIPGRRSQLIDTNQFIVKQTTIYNASNGLSTQNSEKVYTQTRNNYRSRTQIFNFAYNKQNNKESASSQIFTISSVVEKKSHNKLKLMRKSTFLSNQAQFNEANQQKYKVRKEMAYKKQKQIHIPSFLLNKKKQGYNEETVQHKQTLTNKGGQNIPEAQTPRADSKKTSLKKNRSEYFSLSSYNPNQQIVFSPPLNQKISFSKGTASTLCPVSPREQSRRTFKDFQDPFSLKSIQNSLEDSDHRLQDQVQDLFRVQKNGNKKTHHVLQDEIAELFSDQDDQSEEFSEDLRQELYQLF